VTSRAEALEGRYIRITALVLAPFSAGYFLSYLYRTVNSVIGDLLRTEFTLSNSDVGLMTAAYLLGFGLFQVPLGMLLDRYGPRRVNAALLMVAATGAAVFALSSSATGLFIGRGLIGVGVSSALMSSFKAVNQWYPREKWAAMNGVILVMGGLGAVVGSEPIQVALQMTDWRTLFRLRFAHDLHCRARPARARRT
jgi:MFS family permease